MVQFCCTLSQKPKAMLTQLKVAVIGAGISGLIAARELVKESHKVVVFEKSHQLGGLWVYDQRTESDLLGLDPDREIIHTSAYKSLRTNSPRQIMGYSDYTFDGKEYGDPRMFPCRKEILSYLEDFAERFGVTKLIRFNLEVIRVELLESGDKFVVEWKTSEVTSTSSSTLTEVFDAVVVCNGHNTQPRVAIDIPGILEWPNKQLHAHNYRVPEPYKDEVVVVVVIGNGSSAYDISRELANFAKEVHLSSRSPNVKVTKLNIRDNMWQHSKINSVHKDGTVEFQDEVSIKADTIIHCTGYEFRIPFLKMDGVVNIDDKCVSPIYRNVFPPKLAPKLSFVGLIHMGMIFRPAELQSKWIARALSRKVSLPLEKEMLHDIEELSKKMEEKGISKLYTHSLDYQMDYLDWLSDQLGMTRPSQKLKDIYADFVERFRNNHEGFRDAFEKDFLINFEI